MRVFINKHEYIAFGLIFVIIACAVFAPVVLGFQTFFSAIPGLALEAGPYGFEGLKTPWTLDPGAYMWSEVPQTVFWYKRLSAGDFSFWNPYQGGGQPLSGDILSAAWNPFKLVFFSAFPHLKTFDFYLMFRVAAAGFGTFLLLRKLRLPRESAFLGGLAYMFSGYFMNWITGWQLGADMMTPYILFGIELIFERASFRNAIAFAIVFALMVLSMSPEAVIVISLFSILYFLFSRGWPIGNLSGKTALYFTFGLGTAFVICLPMLWDVTLFFSQGMQAHGNVPGMEGAKADIISATALSRAFQVFLSPSSFLEIARIGGLYKNNFILPYIGVFTLCLALAAAAARKDFPYRKHTVFFLAYATAFFLKLADIPPLSWIGFVPPFNQVIFIKYAGTFYFSLAVLAGFGYQAIRDKFVSIRRFLFVLSALIASILVFSAFSQTFRFSYALAFGDDSLAQIGRELEKLPMLVGTAIRYLTLHPYAYAYALAGFSFALILLFAFLWRLGRTRLIILFLALELILYIPKLRDGGFKSFDPFREPPFVAFLKSHPEIARYRIFSIGKVLMPNVASVHGLKDFRANDPIYLRRYVEYMRPALGADHMKRIVSCWCLALTPEDLGPEAQDMLRKASVRFIISEHPLASLKAPYRLIYDHEAFIYEDAFAVPLAYFASGKGDDAILPVIMLSYEPDRVVLRVSTRSSGTLVLNDAYYSGWSAEVNGIPAPIFPWNGMFRGIAIPRAGEYEAVFSYSPFREMPF